MTKQETVAAIAEKVKEVQAILAECSAMADKADVVFKFYAEEGAAYGLCRRPAEEYNFGPGDLSGVSPGYWQPINAEGWVPSSLDC